MSPASASTWMAGCVCRKWQTTPTAKKAGSREPAFLLSYRRYHLTIAPLPPAPFHGPGVPERGQGPCRPHETRTAQSTGARWSIDGRRPLPQCRSLSPRPLKAEDIQSLRAPFPSAFPRFLTQQPSLETTRPESPSRRVRRNRPSNAEPGLCVDRGKLPP